jgi:uncharacterized protein (TIGR00369 family)
MCFVCGRDNPVGLKMQFYDNAVDTVSSQLTIDGRFQGYPEIVHGGILASILDEVVGRVAMVGDHHHFMMTVVLKVQYRVPVLINTPIRAQGKIIRLRGRLGKAQGAIYLPDGTVACDAELTLADMPTEVATKSRLLSLGWKIDAE